MSERNQDEIGKIAKHRFVASNLPVVAGTRVPVTAIQSFAKAGYSAEKILFEYPSLTIGDIEAAIKFGKKDKAA